MTTTQNNRKSNFTLKFTKNKNNHYNEKPLNSTNTNINEIHGEQTMIIQEATNNTKNNCKNTNYYRCHYKHDNIIEGESNLNAKTQQVIIKLQKHYHKTLNLKQSWLI